MRTAPPPPTKMPRLRSGRAKKVVSSATRMWQAEAISSPPPMQAPFSAATCGIGPRRDQIERYGSSGRAAWAGGGLPGLLLAHGGASVKVEPGREIVAVAEDDADRAPPPRRAADGFTHRSHHQPRADRVALGGAVDADKGDLAVQFVG